MPKWRRRRFARLRRGKLRRIREGLLAMAELASRPLPAGVQFFGRATTPDGQRVYYEGETA